MTGKAKAKLGGGSVYATIGGTEYELKPSVFAAKFLSRKYGGLNLVVDRVSKLDFEAIIDVIQAGVGKQIANPREHAKLEEEIFATGFSDDTGQLGTLCIKYVISLMRGGRIMSVEELESAFKAYQEGTEINEDNEGNSKSSSET